MSKRRSWDYDKCREEALKYTTRTDYQKGCGGSYNRANKEGWLDDLCSHMKFTKHPKGYWTYERCKEIALNCGNSSEFYKASPKAYDASLAHGWYKEMTTHFNRLCTSNIRYIYSYEFPDNSVYVGLTYNLKRRARAHKVSGSVHNHAIKNRFTPIMKVLTPIPLEALEASIMEGILLDEYKVKGWYILNKAKTGSLGGTVVKWTKDKCLEEALKYSKKSDFIKNSGSAYQSARKNKWLVDICQHMPEITKPNGYYTIEKCVELALTCSTRKEFKSRYHHAHDLSYKNNWCSVVFSQFTEMKVHKIHSIEDCIIEIKKCRTKTEFLSKNGAMCSQVYKNKWMVIIEKYLGENV